MSAKTKHKPREMFTWNEAVSEYEIRRKAHDAEWRDWLGIANDAHCSMCEVLLIVPFDKREARYRYDEYSVAHELGCPDA